MKQILSKHTLILDFIHEWKYEVFQKKKISIEGQFDLHWISIPGVASRWQEYAARAARPSDSQWGQLRYGSGRTDAGNGEIQWFKCKSFIWVQIPFSYFE